MSAYKYTTIDDAIRRARFPQGINDACQIVGCRNEYNKNAEIVGDLSALAQGLAGLSRARLSGR